MFGQSPSGAAPCCGASAVFWSAVKATGLEPCEPDGDADEPEPPARATLAHSIPAAIATASAVRAIDPREALTASIASPFVVALPHGHSTRLHLRAG
jgi:hypothetical protein